MRHTTGEWFLPRRTDNASACVQTKFTEDAAYVRNNRRPDAAGEVRQHRFAHRHHLQAVP
jgi:hypothetical protein